MTRPSSFSANVALTLVARWVSLALTIVTGVVVARALGPGAKGLFVLTFLLLNQTGSVGSFGIPHALIYFLGSGRISRAEAVGHYLATSIGFGLLLIVPYVAVVHLWGDVVFKDVPPRTLYLLSVLLLPSLLLSNGTGLLRGLNRIDLFNLVTVADAALRLVLLAAALVILRRGLDGAVSATALAASLSGVFSVVVVLAAARCRPRWSVRSLRALVGYGLRSYLTVVLQLTERKADMFLLAWLLPVETAAWQIGLYSTAVALAELPRNIAAAAGTVLLPRISSSDERSNQATVPRVSRNLVAVNVVFAVALTVCARPLIALLYGAAFAPSYLPFVVLLPGVVFAGVLNVFEAEMVGTGRPLKLSAFAGLTLALNVAMNLIAIPRWGIVGAAATSGITYSLLAALLVFDYRARNRDVQLRELLVLSRSDVTHYRKLLRRPVRASAA